MIHVSDVKTLKTISAYKSPVHDSLPTIAFSSDGLLAAGGSTDHVIVWESLTGKIICKLTQPDTTIYSLAFSPDQNYLAIGSEDGVITVWNLCSRRRRCRMVAAQEQGGFQEEIKNPPTNDGTSITCLAFSHDGNNLFSYKENGKLSLWEVATTQERLVFSTPPSLCISIAVSADSRFLAAGNEKGVITIFDVTRDRNVSSSSGHQGNVNALAFSRNGAYMLSGADDTTALLWDVGGLLLRLRLSTQLTRLTKKDFQSYWDDLGNLNARKAYQAIRLLRFSDPSIFPWIRHRLSSEKPPSLEEIRGLIANLDHDSYSKREDAMQQLTMLAGTAETTLRNVLCSHPSLETHRRIEIILERLQGDKLCREELRRIRLVELLERIRTPEAKDLLTFLAANRFYLRSATEANAALQRISRSFDEKETKGVRNR